jgi:hypothetical protein
MPIEINEFVQAALNVIIFVLGLAASAGVLGKVAIWVKGQFENFKATQPENVRALIEWAVYTAASMAEKLELSGELEDYTRSKKNLALAKARELLLSVGLDVDMSALDAVLESILFQNPDQFPSGGSDEQPPVIVDEIVAQ